MGLVRYSANARLLCGAATGLALIAMAAPASAQEEPEAQVAEGEEENRIVVTGLRSAIINSLETKRDSTSIVEVISAEDLGQLPDLSIADSLARLPGVPAQRVRGTSSRPSLSVRVSSTRRAMRSSRRAVLLARSIFAPCVHWTLMGARSVLRPLTSTTIAVSATRIFRLMDIACLDRISTRTMQAHWVGRWA